MKLLIPLIFNFITDYCYDNNYNSDILLTINLGQQIVLTESLHDK